MADNLDLGSVYFKVDADTGKVTVASKAMDDMAESADRAEGQTKKLDGTTSKTNASVGKLGREVEKTDKNIGSFAKSATAAAVALAGMVASSAGLSKLVDTGRSMGVINASLITATGSAQGAKTAFDDLVVLATRLPNSLDDTIGAFIKLKNLGLDPSEKSIISYTNTASAMGKSLNQMIEAVADASTAEFERLKEFGIRAKNQGDEIDFTFRGVTTTVKNNSEEIQGYLLKLGEVDFAGAADARMKTLDGALSNLGDTWDGLFRTIFDSDVGGLIEGGVKTASSAVAALDEMIKNNGNTIKATSIIIGTATGAYAAYRLALIAATIKQYAFNISLTANPIGATVTALGLLAGGLLAYNSYADDAAEKTRALTKANEDLKKSYDNLLNYNDNPFIGLDEKTLTDRYAKLSQIQNDTQRALSELPQDQPIKTIEMEILEDRLKSVKSEIEQVGEALDKVFSKQASSAADSGVPIRESEWLVIPQVAPVQDVGTITPITEETEAYNKQLQELLETYQTTITPLEQLQRDQAKLNELMKTASEKDAPKLAKALEEIGNQIAVIDDPFSSWSSSTLDAANSFQQLAGIVGKGTDEMAVAVAGLNAVQAVNAVINQAGGDPYTAFARMAAMAAAMASLGQAVGGLGGSLSDSSAANQASQGTGSVLGSVDEQSMSIVDSLEDNSDILKDLIGTNKNLVNALSGLVGNIGGASALISRDVPVGFGELGKFSANPIEDLMDNLGLASVFGDWLGLGGLLGGSSKVSDEGIKILGGTLESILNNTTAQAFAEIKTKKYAWSSTKTKTQIQNVSASVENQFDLIFEDIFSAVQSGAEMLGLSNVDISESLENFVVSSFNISLKNMNADQQTAALEAVFSRVFDDLASAVVPFLREFQEAGESTGETMSRLATQLEVTKYALDILGQNIDALGSYEAVQMSEYLIQASGSMETLSQNLTAFVDNFYSDYEQLELLSRQLNKAFDTLNISLPTSAEGFKDLVTGIDATTEAGAEQLASLLELQDAASDYYDLLDDQTDAVRKYSESISDFTKSLLGDSEEITAGAYRAELASALEGDRDALSSITETAQTYLDSQLKTASSAEQYAAIERSVLADMNALQDKLNTVLVDDEDETNRILFDQLAALLNISDGIDAMTGGGFASGGYTGDGAINEIAGVVHKGEYVLSQDMLKNMPVMASAPTSMGANDASVSIMRAVYGQMQNLNNQVAALKEDNYRMGIGMLNNTRDSADVLEFWRQTNVPVSIVP